MHIKDIENIKSEYQITLDARINYELTMRKYRESRFLTKITNANKESLLADNFYQEVINNYPHIKEIVPEYLGFLEMGSLYYLTTEFFESPTTEEVISAIENIDEIIDGNREKYDQFYERFCSWDDGEASKNTVEHVFK